MDERLQDRLRRGILFALRHRPEQFNLRMDSEGWVDTLELADAVNHICQFTKVDDRDDVKKLVLEIGLSDRIQSHEDRSRAAYGHSTVRFNPTQMAIPTSPLFHGTSASNLSLIECFGLTPMRRRFVQLTTDFEYAHEVASRSSGQPLVLQVRTAAALELGIQFYPTSTHVWLSGAIPFVCLQLWQTQPPGAPSIFDSTEPYELIETHDLAEEPTHGPRSAPYYP